MWWFVVRKAQKTDLAAVWTLGDHTPELQVSPTYSFMEVAELAGAIESDAGVFLVAEDQDAKIVGFVHATYVDAEARDWACLVYLAVAARARRQGIGKLLYDACVKELEANGVHRIYGWARSGSAAIRTFMEKQGFAAGHEYTWMEKR